MFCHCKPHISQLFVFKHSEENLCRSCIYCTICFLFLWVWTPEFLFCWVVRFIWWQHGKWQHLVPAVLYQTLYYSLELFWKVCMQVINVLQKRKMFNWHVHSSFWPTLYMFKNLLLNNLNVQFSHISPCVGSCYFLPKESCEILYIFALKCEVLLHRLRCIVMVVIYTSYCFACYHTSDIQCTIWKKLMAMENQCHLDIFLQELPVWI